MSLPERAEERLQAAASRGAEVLEDLARDETQPELAERAGELARIARSLARAGSAERERHIATARALGDPPGAERTRATLRDLMGGLRPGARRRRTLLIAGAALAAALVLDMVGRLLVPGPASPDPYVLGGGALELLAPVGELEPRADAPLTFDWRGELASGDWFVLSIFESSNGARGALVTRAELTQAHWQLPLRLVLPRTFEWEVRHYSGGELRASRSARAWSSR